MPADEAREWLLRFKGVGPKTAAIVLQFSLDRPAFPVDTHIYRVTGRLGLRPENMSVELAHAHFEALLPPETYYPLHLNLIRLGREVCHARKPDCPECVLKEMCRYYEEVYLVEEGRSR
jgi:endonuclease-3